jgi:hypothetical protein
VILANVGQHSFIGLLFILEMEHWLERNYCTTDIPHCHDFIRRHFGACHIMVMEEFMHPAMVCILWGYC